MTPPDPKHPWVRLVAAARHAPADRDTAAPYGFATRIAALAMNSERVTVSLFERFSLRALGVAALLAIVSIATNYSTIASVFAEEEGVVTDDPVSEMVNLVS